MSLTIKSPDREASIRQAIENMKSGLSMTW